MLKRLAAPASCSSCLLAFFLAFVSPRCTLSIGADKNMVNKEDYYSATVNATVLDHKGNPQQMVTKNDGRYGQNSPKTEAKGIVIAPAAVNGVNKHLNFAYECYLSLLVKSESDVGACSFSGTTVAVPIAFPAVDLQGCCPYTRFVVPPKTTHWVAIMQRGKCTFKEKILKAAAFNASAVIIYNNGSKEDTVTMAHEGTGDIVAVMITESFGKEILVFLEKNQTVLVSVMVGSRGPVKNINRGSLVFVSISFIVLMIISSAWLIFYFIQKIRDTSARDRSQRRLGDAAKKAISKLTTRTVKRGDKETEPDFNHCAVCIEGYQLNDVVRILPCKHVFHKMCVDPWLNEHCTCPMCKLNILKALGIMPNLPCVDNMGFDMERMSRSQTSSQRTALMDLSSETSISLEPLRHSSSSQLPSDDELIPRTGEINIAVTSGNFFNRNSMPPRSVVCEMELPDIQATLDMYDDNKS
ncbi:E3 ubiquitin-protein ligase RNF130 [Triplophysa tibetana]|uniref:E3 ubiquitin-protein ligase RNF130 n=1 Tax=Triplophysa tibetana TaxID=1572043 RepID=A0A5A9NJA3_9TELE|nr:E3 ubiquitin-protein ligase RNF130 [Triplophysa tibetana]